MHRQCWPSLPYIIMHRQCTDDLYHHASTMLTYFPVLHRYSWTKLTYIAMHRQCNADLYHASTMLTYIPALATSSFMDKSDIHRHASTMQCWRTSSYINNADLHNACIHNADLLRAETNAADNFYWLVYQFSIGASHSQSQHKLCWHIQSTLSSYIAVIL